MRRILLTISILALLGFNLAGAVPVFATSHCYQPQSGDGVQIQGEGVLPTFGPTCAVVPSPQPTTPPRPTSPPQPTATSAPLPPTNPPPTELPRAGNVAVASTVFFGGLMFVFVGFSVLGLSPRLRQGH